MGTEKILPEKLWNSFFQRNLWYSGPLFHCIPAGCAWGFSEKRQSKEEN